MEIKTTCTALTEPNLGELADETRSFSLVDVLSAILVAVAVAVTFGDASATADSSTRIKLHLALVRGPPTLGEAQVETLNVQNSLPSTLSSELPEDGVTASHLDFLGLDLNECTEPFQSCNPLCSSTGSNGVTVADLD